jgi:lysophospholipase L1-like esterase
MAHALGASEPLTQLLARVKGSRDRLGSVLPALPPELLNQVRPGPLDDKGWTLLASNTAVAAKLRQLVPALEAALAAAGWQPTPIRIRIQSA